MTSNDHQYPSEEAASAVDGKDSTPASNQSSASGPQNSFDARPGMKSPAHRGFSFLQLPPEIRNRIYDLVFVKPGYIGSGGSLTKAFYYDAAKWRNLAFARSCRQVYKESADIFYARNGFEFFYIRPFLEFIEAIGYKRRNLLTKIRFHHTKGTPFIVLRYLKSCKNLEELEVYARCIKKKTNSWWEYPMKNAKSFFLGSHSVIEFEEVFRFGKAIASDEEPSEGKHLATMFLVESLQKVKREERGKYKR